jgi:hypothetical protein
MEVLWAHGTSGFPEGEIPGCSDGFPVYLWRLLCNRDLSTRPRIVQVYRVSEHHQLQKTMIPTPSSSSTRKFTRSAYLWTTRLETMTKWQAHKKLGAAGGSNLFCLSESECILEGITVRKRLVNAFCETECSEACETGSCTLSTHPSLKSCHLR